jgi:hypothetical protein
MTSERYTVARAGEGIVTVLASSRRVVTLPSFGGKRPSADAAAGDEIPSEDLRHRFAFRL